MSEQSTAEVATATVLDGSWKLQVTYEEGKAIAEVSSFGVTLSITTLTAGGVVTVEDPASGPTVHRFADTSEAYDATQCRADIRDGDVLVVEPERVIGILDAAWPFAVTQAHGEFHALKIPASEHKDGRYTASADLAERIAAELGFPLAVQPARTA
ncbi:hypothetical protein ABZX90_41485 [Streptomyces sp. NPDC002935]|uniref:hypothetical protein n=1 Tax=Streptomyces sp. NPDC002935 TaxID=3154545 RepID=UPI0033B854EC